MIEKEIKEYKQGRDTVQRINIRKIDNLKGKVCILEINEYKELALENKTLSEKIANQSSEISELKEKIAIQKKEDKTIQSIIEIQQKAMNEINQQKDETIKELDQQHHESIEKITKEHQDRIKETYDSFNKEINRYMAVNQLQNQALKQILGLGFIDLLRNKHKNIAKNQIKELDKKPVYELTPKE